MNRKNSIHFIYLIVILSCFKPTQPSAAQNDIIGGSPTIGKIMITKVTGNSAHLEGIVLANGAGTTAWFEWGEEGSRTLYTPPQTFDLNLGYIIRENIYGIRPESRVRLRLAAQNEFGISYGADTTITAMRGPVVSEPLSVLAENITANSARLRARCRLHGADTWIEFDGGVKMKESLLGCGKAYLGSGNAEIETTFTVTGLIPNSLYAVRILVSSNNLQLRGEHHHFSTLSDVAIKGLVIPIKVEDRMMRKNIRRFGVHTMATNCIDERLDEYELPPPPPGTALEARFIADCRGLGTYTDIRPHISPSQTDTYKLKFQTDPAGGYPVKISWPDLSGLYLGRVILKVAGDSVDMTEVNSYEIGSPEIGVVTISAEFPVPISRAPDVITNGAPNVGPVHGLMRAEVNPNGLATFSWFEWGVDISYGSRTRAKGIGNEAGPLLTDELILGLETGRRYHYRAVARNQGGMIYGEDETFTTSTPTSLLIHEGLPDDYFLYQNYPNPSNPSTLIIFRLPEPGSVTMRVYNAVGQLVSELINGDKPAGLNSVRWDGSGCATGHYYYRLQAITISNPRKIFSMARGMLLLR